MKDIALVTEKASENSLDLAMDEQSPLAEDQKRVKQATLAIIVPCYNEEIVLNETARRLVAVLDSLKAQSKINPASFICFIDDGSSDKTWEIVSGLNHINKQIKGLKLSKNVGHQYALLAGFMYAKDVSDIAVSIDADLQQDENAIFKFIDKYYEGHDIVYGVRGDRKTDKAFKKLTALSFYKLMNLMGVKVIKNHSDYRLLSKKALDALSNFKEANLFLRGVFPLLGFRSTTVHFYVRERFAGRSKYSLKKMLSLALDGITSFSIVPIRIISFIGFLIFIFSLGMSGFVIASALLGKAISGWASTVLPIYFIGGIQLLSLGLMGEYLGKIYKEVKRRPRYIIDEELL